MSSRVIASSILAVLLAAGSAAAHHNMSAYFDFNNRVTITGNLTKVDWRNPHLELIVDAKDGEAVQTWRLEGPSPAFFRDRDISKADFEGALGKPVTFEASRARDGTAWGLLRTMTLPGGKLVSACPQNC
jgi:Family of unknown function (DUF6152)